MTSFDGPRSDSQVVRIAAVADLHAQRGNASDIQSLLEPIDSLADILLLCGDLTEDGLPHQASILAAALRRNVTVPVLAVLGNHDLEGGVPQEVEHVLRDSGVAVLDGDTCELHGIAFAGTRGSGGGFGDRITGPWETSARRESKKLDRALKGTASSARIVLTHYAPIEATLCGEPRNIIHHLGSRHLESVLDRHGVVAAFHGHAHFGSPQGYTRGGTPVFNVAWPVQRHRKSDQSGIRVLHIEAPVAEFARPMATRPL